MNVLGKTLVFINLVFSLIVGFQVTQVYIARTHFAAELERRGKMLEALKASNDQALKARDDAVAQLDAYVKKAEADQKALDAQLRAQQDQTDQLSRQLLAAKQDVARLQAVVTGAQNDVARRQSDVERMRASYDAELKKNIELTRLNNQLRETATAEQIRAKALLERNNQLEATVQDMVREAARARANFQGTGAAPGGAAAIRGSKNPPPDNVEGVVKATDPGSNLVKISIGSDAGLAKGQTLEVFRLAAVPSQSRYLGTIRILEVTPTEAVGQPTGRMSAQVQPGDRVASRILGS